MIRSPVLSVFNTFQWLLLLTIYLLVNASGHVNVQKTTPALQIFDFQL